MIEMVMFFTAGMAVGRLLNLIVTKWAEYVRFRRIYRLMYSSDEEFREREEALGIHTEESE